MGATLTAYNDALREIWTQDRLEEQLYKGTAFMDVIAKTSRFTVGGIASTPLHVSRSGGITVLPQGGGTLNAAGNQGVDKAQYNYTHQHGQIAIQGDVLDQTSTNSLSVANVLDTEVTGMLTDLRRNVQRQLFQNGDGQLVKCGTSNSATITLDSVEGVNVLERGWLYVGAPVDVGTAASQASLASGELITAVNEATPSVTITTICNVTGSNFVSWKAARSGATSYESNGLRNMVSTTADFGTLTVAGQPAWKAANVDTTTQALSLSLMLQQDQKCHQRTGDPADTVLTGLKQARKFYELLQTQVRYASNSNIDAGQKPNSPPSWHGMEIMVDPDCQNEDMYFLQKKHVFIVAIDKPYWQNKVTGGEILSWIQGTDSYGAKLTYRFNLATNRRNGHARLGGLS